MVSTNGNGDVAGAVELPEHTIRDGITYTLTGIASQAFSDNKNLKSIKISQLITEIGNSAFANCNALEEVTFDEGDKICKLGDNIFNGCSKLKTLNINRILETDGHDAPFAQLPINQLNIGAKATILVKNLFSGLEKLQSVTIPRTTNLIFPNVFGNCPNMKTVIFEETSNPLYMINQLGESMGIEVLNLNRPLYIGSVEIGSNSYECEPNFAKSTSLTTINFGSNMTGIAEGMFSGCTSLRSITIPKTIEIIKDKAFAGCSNLTSINIEDSDEPITIISSTNNNGEGTTFEDDPIGTIYLGRNVEFIGTELSPFKNCQSLSNLTIGNKVTEINHYLFYGCSAIIMLAVPSSVLKVGNYAFYDCNGSKSLMLSSSVQSIGDYAFYNCNSLSKITIPNSVETVGDYAFRNCHSAENISLGKNVKSIGNFAFLDCYNATKITLGENIETIGDNAFYNCAAIKEITIPNSTVDIGANCFTMCSSAEKITIGDGVKTIGARAFSDRISATEIVLGSSLQKIEDFAFFNCEAVKSIHIRAKNPPVADKSVFSDYEAKLYVPEGTMPEYINPSNNCWYLFSIFEESISKLDETLEPAAKGTTAVYNMHGVKVGDSLNGLPHGVYIIRQGSKTTKHAI